MDLVLLVCLLAGALLVGFGFTVFLLKVCKESKPVPKASKAAHSAAGKRTTSLVAKPAVFLTSASLGGLAHGVDVQNIYAPAEVQSRSNDQHTSAALTVIDLPSVLSRDNTQIADNSDSSKKTLFAASKQETEPITPMPLPAALSPQLSDLRKSSDSSPAPPQDEPEVAQPDTANTKDNRSSHGDIGLPHEDSDFEILTAKSGATDPLANDNASSTVETPTSSTSQAALNSATRKKIPPVPTHTFKSPTSRLSREQEVNPVSPSENRDSQWWQQSLTNESYGLVRSLSSKAQQGPPDLQRRRRNSNPFGIEREVTKEFVREKQSVELIDFLREPPEDYFVVPNNSNNSNRSLPPQTSQSSRLSRKAPVRTRKASLQPDSPSDSDVTSVVSPIPAPLSERGPRDMRRLPPTSWPKRRPSLKIDSTVAERSIKEKEAMAVWTDFSMMLRSPIGLDAFMGFLVKNISAENLLFYQAVEDLRPNPTVEKVVSIFNDFVRDNATSMINLRGSTQSKIINEFARVANENRVTLDILNLLDIAQKEIYNLMETDLFSRFIVSSFSEPWKEECKTAVIELHQRQRRKMQSSRSVSSTMIKKYRSRGGSGGSGGAVG